MTIERANNERLLRSLLEANAPKVEVRQEPPNLQPISNRAIPWVQMQRKLEAESRAAAEQMRATEAARKLAAPKDDELENLEKELGVVDAS